MWKIPDYIDPNSVDKTWQPPQTSQPYVYHFLSQHTDTDSVRIPVGVSGVTYTVAGATDNQIVFDSKVIAVPLLSRWTIPDYIDKSTIDFTWHPNAFDPPYIYHFSSKHHRSSGLIYTVPGATQIKYVNPFEVKSIIQMDKWTVPKNIDIDKFDFTWHPPGDSLDYEYYFATQWQRSGGPIYKGSEGKKFVSHPVATATVQMDKWTVPNNIDVTEFDFSWHPDLFEKDYAYYFPTQHQRDGGPIYNKQGKDGIKYTTAQKIRVAATQIFYMDFLNPESAEQLKYLKEKWPDIKSTRYVDNHLNVLKRVVSQADTEFIWVISSIANYSNFDFTWHPEEYQNEMIHVFPYDSQVRGDTFYINVRSFKTQMIDLDMLDWFNVICYHKDISVPRFAPEIVYYKGDDLISAIKNYNFKSPYAAFSNLPNIYVDYDQCLWSAKDRKADWRSPSKGVALIPREVKLHLKTQIYDYPYLEKQEVLRDIFIDEPLDIIYISNGEPDAEHWYRHLVEVLDREQFGGPYLMHKNTVKRITNVNGRTAAYQAAAKASHTPWFFAVFAKIEVARDFDWGWQPDMWQGPKHYIFNCKNPVNDLEYGHMGMIAYNKNLVLQNDGTGIDFTLNQPHESVPLLSGVAHYNQDAWTTWRTAFREVVKLKYFNQTSPNVETEYRLKVWSSVAKGNYAEWSLKGAQDALNYYESVAGDYSQLLKTYEWAWLRQYYEIMY